MRNVSRHQVWTGIAATALVFLATTEIGATSGELYPYPDLVKRDIQEWEDFLYEMRSEPKNRW
jgi:hypothetical protein